MKKLFYACACLLLAVPCAAGTITIDDGPADWDMQSPWMKNFP
jgi:hypothetical protein